MKKHVISIIAWLSFLIWDIISYMPSKILRKLFFQALWLRIAKNSFLNIKTRILLPFRIKIWTDAAIWRSVILDGRKWIEIWNHCNISDEVAIWTLQHDPQSSTFDVNGWKVIIEDYCWISFRSIILPWVRIWKWSIVAAWSVVTKDIPEYSIYWWVPAKKIWERNKKLKYLVNPSIVPFI